MTIDNDSLWNYRPHLWQWPRSAVNKVEHSVLLTTPDGHIGLITPVVWDTHLHHWSGQKSAFFAVCPTQRVFSCNLPCTIWCQKTRYSEQTECENQSFIWLSILIHYQHVNMWQTDTVVIA